MGSGSFSSDLNQLSNHFSMGKVSNCRKLNSYFEVTECLIQTGFHIGTGFALTDDQWFDAASGNAALNGVPVKVTAA